jgi:hypothetical protein
MDTLRNIRHRLQDVFRTPNNVHHRRAAAARLSARRRLPDSSRGYLVLTGLLLLGVLCGCVTSSPEKSRERMTGFEREIADKLSLIKKGMTASEVVAIMGMPDGGDLSRDVFRYSVWSKRPIRVVVNNVVEAKTLPRLLDSCSFEGNLYEGSKGSVIPGFAGVKLRDMGGKRVSGIFLCSVESTSALEHWLDVLTRELPPGAEFSLPPLTIGSRDCMARINFTDGRVTGVYLIHPAPSARGAFYYNVLEE